MKLGLTGHTVDSITFDYRVAIAFGDGSVITIETAFKITHADGRVVMIDPEAVEEPDAILVALHDEVEEAEYTEGGSLRLQMKRTTWTIEPDPEYESWSLGSPGTPSRVVSGPVGSLLVWS